MSCLFKSLAPAVCIDPEILRETIAAYLKTDPLLLDDIRAGDVIKMSEGQNLQEYTAKMSQSTTWGGAIEIKAFCELFHMDVTVHVLYTGKQFTVDSSKEPSHNVHISYTGNHFEPMFVQIL